MSLSIVDSHCHLNFNGLNERLPEVLENAKQSQVDWMLCVSVSWEDYPSVLQLAKQHSNIYASVGVHPNHDEGHDPSIEELVAAGNDTDVVAVGETGLDYFRSSGDLDWQHQRFKRHIEAAKILDKPLIIHTREAAPDTMRILKELQARDAGGVMHCFAEDWQVAQQALEIGFYLSFSGIVTFKSAKSVQEVARKVPLDRLLVETDSPYLAPVPHRGKTNEPAYTRHTAEFIAEIRGIDIEELSAASTENFFRLFSAAKK